MRTTQLNMLDSLDPISEIVAMLAHQINSPLSCILASAELSIRHANDEIAIRKHCDNIIKYKEKLRLSAGKAGGLLLHPSSGEKLAGNN